MIKEFLHQGHVNRWARWFDQVAPNWHRHVNLRALDQRLSDWCVVGQFTTYDVWGRRSMPGLTEETKQLIWNVCWRRDIWRTRAFYFNRYRPAWKVAIQQRLDADEDRWSAQGQMIEQLRADLADAWVLEGELATAGD